MIPLIAGLERAEIMRFGYAVEYDFAPPPAHAHPRDQGGRRPLFAGQINGTNRLRGGRRQGLIAASTPLGSSARPGPLVLERAQAYLGVLK